MVSAERLTMVMMPYGSTPMTPAVTPASTASEKRRRSSTRSLASRISLRCDFSSSSILLNVSPSEATSPSDGAHRHRDVEIAGRDLVGRADQLADRPDQPVGDRDAGPDRRQHDDQRQAEIEQGEGDLRRAPVGLQAAIFVGVGGDDLARPDDLGIDQADRVEIGVRRSARSLTMAPTMLLVRGSISTGWPSVAVLARASVGGCGISKSARVCALMTNEPSARISAAWASARPDGLLAHEVAKAGAVEAVERARIVEVVGHRERRALQVAGVLPDIGLGDRQRRIDDRLGADLEPAVEADVERDRGDDRDQDGRDARRPARTSRRCAHAAATPPCRAAAPWRCGGPRGRSARSANSTKAALMAISDSVVVSSGAIGVTPTRMANETAAVTSAPTTATTPGSASSRRPSAARRAFEMRV